MNKKKTDATLQIKLQLVNFIVFYFSLWAFQFIQLSFAIISLLKQDFRYTEKMNNFRFEH